jgi:hypothetical protein
MQTELLDTVEHPVLGRRHNLALGVANFVVDPHDRVAEPAALLRVVHGLPFFVVERFNAGRLEHFPEPPPIRPNVTRSALIASKYQRTSR